MIFDALAYGILDFSVRLLCHMWPWHAFEKLWKSWKIMILKSNQDHSGDMVRATLRSSERRTHFSKMMYSITLWRKFFEPVILQHCASAQAPFLWTIHFALFNFLSSWNPSFSSYWRDLQSAQSFAYVFSRWSRCNPCKADWPYLGPQKTPSQTNTLI